MSNKLDIIEIEIVSRVLTPDIDNLDLRSIRDMNFRNLGADQALVNENIPIDVGTALAIDIPDQPTGIKYVRRRSVAIGFTTVVNPKLLFIGQKEVGIVAKGGASDLC